MRDRLWMAVCFLVASSLPASAAVLTFEDVALGSSLTGTSYGGLTWGTSLISVPAGELGEWGVWNAGITGPNARSGENFLINLGGADQMGIQFPEPVVFDGAWFATKLVGDRDYNSATAVRFRDDRGNVSDWLTLTFEMQFLSAGFAGSTAVWIERRGAPGVPDGLPDSAYQYEPGQWYAMDDLSYSALTNTAVPEPSTLALVASAALVALRRRRRPAASGDPIA